MTQPLNTALNNAAEAKEDEFYTQLRDVEKEMRYYREHFRGKVVYCNCDDPRESAFFHYFSYLFNTLGLKKLVATCYKNQNRDLFSKYDSEKAICLEYFGSDTGMPLDSDIKVTTLTGDGDFRSQECINYLQEADIVITNPPFSLFDEYINLLIEHNKQFIIIGPQNAITYKSIFPLLKDNKVWLGYNNGEMEFRVPPHYPPKETRYRVDDNGTKWRSMGNVCWFTNIDISKRHEELVLYKHYNEVDNPIYDNFDAIEVSRYTDIPMDYKGAMGVPVTFFNKYNPEQFEILGNLGSYGVDGYSLSSAIYINGRKKFKRILIRNKKV
jgi:hypothetical protein